MVALIGINVLITICIQVSCRNSLWQSVIVFIPIAIHDYFAEGKKRARDPACQPTHLQNHFLHTSMVN
jgi:hypothetical protein